MSLKFETAEDAFSHFLPKIRAFGVDYGNKTKALLNQGFYIVNPMQNKILNPERNWSINYANREWEWYMSANRSVENIKKYAPIWDKMHSGNNIVNSNYGYQWMRNLQLQKCIEQLSKDSSTRQAWITIFDGKEKDEFQFDTPCTLNIGFKIIDDTVNMDVLMRSNDLWYGFCNDQYCFSNLLSHVVYHLNYKEGYPKYRTGFYYHFAADLHLYEKHYEKINP